MAEEAYIFFDREGIRLGNVRRRELQQSFVKEYEIGEGISVREGLHVVMPK
jgi:hypothetical protein